MSYTRSVTMAHMKPEDGNNQIWQGYSLQTPSTTAVPHQPYDSSYHSNSMTMPFHGRTQKGTYRSVDIPSIHTRPAMRGANSVILTASPPPLHSHQSFPSLKRAFHSSEDLTYGGNLQEFREEISEAPKPTISQDHRLLSFGRKPEKHTIFDTQGRVQKVELTAQIHGMFFLSELAATPGESLLMQPELTCYRRNLFQISGNVTIPKGTLSLMTERGERMPIVGTEVVISASESVDGNIVKLIVIPWKTPPPNSPEIPSGQEHEPASIPLLPFDEGAEANSDFVVHPIAYRRLQFRIATANNGRRRELQQHFTLHLNVVGTLANGLKLNVCETSTAPIVVRGRSPRNFQARKEIPLVGSSSSRGHAPELHIATNIPPQGPTADEKAKIGKPQQLELPRSPFTFDSNSIVGSPSMLRQPAYSAWNAAHTPGHGTAPNTPSYPSSSMGQAQAQSQSLDSYLNASASNSGIQAHVHSPPSVPPIRQYTSYHHVVAPPLEPVRFVDNNPRPAKSPRHIAPPEVQPLPSNGYPEYATRFASPYTGGQVQARTPAPEYFPPVLPMWTSGPSSGAGYGTVGGAGTGVGAQQYEFPSEQYVKEEGGVGQPHYTWGSS